jgi:putative PEP-CTERM system histidine kinase
MESGAISIEIVSYLIGSGAFLLLALPVWRHWNRQWQGGLLLLASATTLGWTAAVAGHVWLGSHWVPARAAATLELLRSFAWIGFLISLIYSRRRAGSGATAIAWRLVIPAAVLATGLAATLLWPAGPRFYPIIVPPLFGILLPIGGILLTETLFRNSTTDERWHVKFICLGTGIVFAYDLLFYANAILFGGIDLALFQARGAIQALVAVLLAIAAMRNEMWRTNIALSREIVLRSTTFVASGVYLVLMAAVGYFLRDIDQLRGPVFQVVFFVGAIAVLLIVLFSGTSRAHLKVLINKHFFKGKYDWRHEWLRFMQTLSTTREQTSLERRAITAIANVVDSPGGAMWLQDAGRYTLATDWNLADLELELDKDDPLSLLLNETGMVIDLDQARSGRETHDSITVPESLASHPRAWLLVPLLHQSLLGFVVLARPRAPKVLGWEDYDLLKTIGRQTASYVAERRSAEALDEARQFELFNKRFAFVVHDMKNLLSQLSLVSSNFQKFGDNQEFRQDVVQTLGEASAKIKRILERLNMPGQGVARDSVSTVAPLLERLMERKQSEAAELTLRCEAPEAAVFGDSEGLETILDHLIQNALDAVEADGTVEVVLKESDENVVIEVTDDGPGMEKDFIRNELFKPFHSTKSHGMGIGAYQCRAFARELGGDLQVKSRPGHGTTMRMTLPRVRAEAAEAPEASPVGPS